MSQKKNIERFLTIGLNGIRSLLSPLLSFVLAYLIIHNYSKILWGEFVTYLLYFFVVNMILNWGGKEYLLRQFSKEPAKIISNWQTYFLARVPLLVIVILSIPIFFSWQEFQFLAIWISTSFVSNSLAPVYLYKRNYIKVIVAEIASFALLIILIFSKDETFDIHLFGSFYAIYCSAKAILLFLFYSSFFKFKTVSFQPKLLWLSFPFLAMALAGFFQGKIDLYVFTFFSEKAILADYQIISGFFIFSQSIATIIILPYAKNVYRMKSESVAKLNRLIGLTGIAINFISLIIIVVVLNRFFKIELDSWQIAVGYFIGLPSYFYAIRVFYLFSSKKEIKVLVVSIWSLLVNLTLSVILLNFGWSITGVLIANAVSQIVCLILYLHYKIHDRTT